MTELPDAPVSTPRRHAVPARHPLSVHAVARHLPLTASARRRVRLGRSDLSAVRELPGQCGLSQAVDYRPRHRVAEIVAFSPRQLSPAPAVEHPYTAAMRLQRVRFGLGA